MSASIVNETTYTVWCGECPFSTDPTIYRERAEAAADAHDAEKHPEQVERGKLLRV
jgi:hypothetical protein